MIDLLELFAIHLTNEVFVWDYNLSRLYNPTNFELVQNLLDYIIRVDYNSKQTPPKLACIHFTSYLYGGVVTSVCICCIAY
jgi:hypothetical protein